MIAAVAIFLVAIAATGTRGLGRDKGHPDYGSVVARAGVGALIVAVLAVAATIAAYCYLRTQAQRGSREAAAIAESPRAMVARGLPWIITAIALGAVLGAATAPLYRAGTSAVDDTAGQPVDPRLPEFEAQLTTDARGDVRLQIDSNGDGAYEVLTPCPRSTRTNRPPDSWLPATPDDPLLVPVDFECDGIIDAYARVESWRSFPAGTPSGPTFDSQGNPIDDTAPQLEGRFYRDSDGVVRLYLDTDVDGIYETPTEPCPLRPGEPLGHNPDPGLLVPIDVDCDDTVDAYARVDDFTPRSNPNPVVPDVERQGPPIPPRTPPTAPPATPPTSAQPIDSDDPERADAEDGDGVGLLPMVLLVALIGALVAVFAVVLSRWLRGRDASEPAAEPPDTDDQAVQAFASSLEDLSRPDDPRAAILGAYARLLERLAAAGLPRRPSETPGVYLDRCVRQLGLPPGPMTELTELFSLARFSTHPITEAQRDRAAELFHQSVSALRARQATTDDPVHADAVEVAP